MCLKTSIFTILAVLIILILSACGPSPVLTVVPLSSVTPSPNSDPTETPKPTITPEIVEVEATPTPEETIQTICLGIFKQDLFFYPIPSDAMPGEWLGSGAYVEILGQLNEPVWYKVNLLKRTGWVLQAHTRLEDQNCKVPQIELAESLGLQGTPILQDTFRDSQNWILINNPDQRPERVPNSVNNYTLNLDGYFERAALSAPALEEVSTFELATSYWRQNGGERSSYVGLQYGDDENYFEIRILGTCDIEVETGDGFFEKQTTRNERNICKDDLSDFLFVRWDGSGILEVGQNDMTQPYRFNIGNSIPETGKIQLISKEARTQFDFIAVTEN